MRVSKCAPSKPGHLSPGSRRSLSDPALCLFRATPEPRPSDSAAAAMEPFRVAEEIRDNLVFEGTVQLGQAGYGAVYLFKHLGQKAALKLGKSWYHAESMLKAR